MNASFVRLCARLAEANEAVAPLEAGTVEVDANDLRLVLDQLDGDSAHRADRSASITLRYDPDNHEERQHAARIVGGDYERMRCALWAVSERLRRIARGKDEVPGLMEYGADWVLALIEDELGGVDIE